MKEEIKIKLKWGFDSGFLVILIMLVFVSFHEIIGFNPYAYIFGIITFALIMGLIFGSEFFIESKGGKS